MLHLGYLYNQAEDLKGAEGALRRASYSSPNMPDVWYYLGIAQAERGDLKAAEASFRRCASLNPKAYEARFQLGVILDRQGKERNRFACDNIKLLRILYQTGKVDLKKMGSKFKDLARIKGMYAEPQCSYDQYGLVKVIEPPIFLGSFKNSNIGRAPLFMWAIHVDNSPKDGNAKYWILYVDEKGSNPWFLEGAQA